METAGLPTTLQQVILHFADPDVALAFAVRMRWADGKPVCPRCKSHGNSFVSTRRVWECKGCKRQFSVKIGTVLEDSPIGLDKWLCAMWLIANAKNGISSYEIHRALGVTQKTAWFLLHRIRLIMKNGSIEKLSGNVEADETFVGGKLRMMNKKTRARKLAKGQLKGGGTVGKAIVMGLLERHGKARVKVVPKTRRFHLVREITENVEPGSNLYTDALQSYSGLIADYAHEVIDHTEAYVRNNVIHTNGMENFWSLFKRTLKGTYVSVEPYHLQAYADEQCFRFNNREVDDVDRFVAMASNVAGKRLTYAELTGKTLNAAVS